MLNVADNSRILATLNFRAECQRSEGKRRYICKEKGENPNPLSPSPAPKKQNPKDEIDAIFAAGKKRKKSDDGMETPSAVKDGDRKDSGSDQSIVTRKKQKEKRGPRKKTSDGLTVYTEEELGIGKKDDGGTAL